jgi:hypothetical protein
MYTLVKSKLQNKASFSQRKKGNGMEYWPCEWIWNQKYNNSFSRQNNTKRICSATIMPLNFYQSNCCETERKLTSVGDKMCCYHFGASNGTNSKWEVKYFNEAKCLPNIYFILSAHFVQNKYVHHTKNSRTPRGPTTPPGCGPPQFGNLCAIYSTHLQEGTIGWLKLAPTHNLRRPLLHTYCGRRPLKLGWQHRIPSTQFRFTLRSNSNHYRTLRIRYKLQVSHRRHIWNP